MDGTFQTEQWHLQTSWWTKPWVRRLFLLVVFCLAAPLILRCLLQRVAEPPPIELPELGESLRLLTGHTGPVDAVAFDADGKHLVSASHDKTVRFWDVATGKQIGTSLRLEDHQMLWAAIVDRHLVSGGRKGDLKFERLDWPKELESFPPMKLDEDLTCSNDGKTLAGAFGKILPEHDRIEISLWDLRSGNRLAEIEGGACYERILTANPMHAPSHQCRCVEGVAISHDGKLVAAGGCYDGDHVWNVETFQPLPQFKGQNMCGPIAFSPDGKVLAGCGDGNYPLKDTQACKAVRIWDLESGQARFTLRGHPARVRCVAFSPSGDFLATGADDYTIRIWKVATGKLVVLFNEHRGPVNRVTFSPSGRLLASASRDGTVRLWDLGKWY